MRHGTILFLALLALGCAMGQPANSALNEAVRAAETAFARTMTERDLEGFASFLSEEAVFVGNSSLRGRKAIADGWSVFFTEPEAPFSWHPALVEVLESGNLALSSGPVLDPGGKRVGVFNSIWRLESDGEWRVIFDKGCPVCEDEPDSGLDSNPDGEE